MIPKSQHLDALLREKFIPLFIAGTLIGKTVAAAVKFHREFCARAIEIQEVNAAGVLAAKFEFAETLVTQQTPQPSFGVGGLFAELAGEVTGVCRACAVLTVLRFAPQRRLLLPHWGRRLG